MFLLDRHRLTGFRFFSRKHGRISDTNPREKRSLRKLGRHVIVTLDPNKFAEKKQQRLHIGNLQAFRPHINANTTLTGPHISLLKQSAPIYYDNPLKTDTRLLLSFPPDTKAFLYYFMSPEKPRIAGELRLRVTSSDDATSFESGSDLLRTDGRPWSRPLYFLTRYYSPLYEKLREERLIPDDLDTALSSTLPKISPGPIYSRSYLYTLNDTFIVDFSARGFSFFVITEQGVEMPRLLRLFHDARVCKGRPYTGSALVRFERSTLLDHKGTRTVVLRILKIITPVKCVMPLYDGYICCPTEGELHRINRNNRQVWSVNIDNSKKGTLIRGLQLLWDA